MTPADIRRQVVMDEHDLAADGSLAVVSKRIIRRDRYQTHLYVVPLGLDGPPGPSRGSSGPVAITSGIAVRARRTSRVRWPLALPVRTSCRQRPGCAIDWSAKSLGAFRVPA